MDKYEYTTTSISTILCLRDYLYERNIKYKFVFSPQLKQWTMTMWLARPEDFDAIVQRFGPNLEAEVEGNGV